MKTLLRSLIIAAIATTPLWTSVASASQSCVAKCATEESACLKRTNNKGQCGSKAKECTAKCK